MDLKHLINELGGPAAVGRLFVPPIRGQAVSLWITSGRIPAERVPTLERRARELGLELRAEDMRPDVEWSALRCACEAAR